MNLRFWQPRHVTLVIDDGPTAMTPRLLTELEASGHRAVLFILGWNAVTRMDTLIDAVRRGFALGNHSYRHARFSELGIVEAREEIVRTEEILNTIYREAGAARPGKWFRFPYEDAGSGPHFTQLQELLSELEFRRPASLRRRLPKPDRDRLDWQATLHTADWKLPEEPDFRAVMRRAAPGDVIELHDKLDTVERYTAPAVEELARRSLLATVPQAGGGRDV